MSGRPLGIGPEDEKISYDESKHLAQNKDAAVRASLAAREDVRPEVLCFLAGDVAPEVRQAIAVNPRTPAHAGPILAQDKDEAVRQLLAEKVARLTPELSSDHRNKAYGYLLETLDHLARDQVSRVRQILAEALKDEANAPAEVIQRLAWDEDVEVAVPVLELSPLLTDQDLLEIIDTGCVSGKLRAISRRQGVGEQVSDAIVATADRAAITELLDNKSAQIREETLDRLIDEAVGVPEWQRPLVRRPHLSSGAALKLATFVATSLLTELQARSDLDRETARRVAQTVHRRLHDIQDPTGANNGSEPGAVQESEDDALLRALASGDFAMVRSSLALRANMPEKTIDKVIKSSSPKAITAVAWKAGLSMRFATQLQLRMAGIAPQQAINATGGQDYPLSDEEMNWQLEFFESLTN